MFQLEKKKYELLTLIHFQANVPLTKKAINPDRLKSKNKTCWWEWTEVVKMFPWLFCKPRENPTEYLCISSLFIWRLLVWNLKYGILLQFLKHCFYRQVSIANGQLVNAIWPSAKTAKIRFLQRRILPFAGLKQNWCSIFDLQNLPWNKFTPLSWLSNCAALFINSRFCIHKILILFSSRHSLIFRFLYTEDDHLILNHQLFEI